MFDPKLTIRALEIYPVKYIPKFYTSIEDIKNAEQFQAYYKEKFPTAYNLVQYFQDSVSTAAYLILEPHSYIDWHHDVENPDGTRISVHIPLDIPNGDLALDVDGELNRWEDIFAFYNEKIHRAWNNTDHPRLIFLLDFTKKSCGVT